MVHLSNTNQSKVVDDAMWKTMTTCVGGCCRPSTKSAGWETSSTELQMNGLVEIRKPLFRCLTHGELLPMHCRYIWNCNQINLLFTPEESVSQTVSLALPETVVDGSARAYFSVLGK